MKTALLSLICAAWFGFASSAPAASGGKALAIPDFTKGDAIPAKAKHDWNLGPTGLRGWMFCDKLVTTDARQIAITAVDQGSPADGLIAVGDVLLGAGGKPFSYDPRTEMGRAITAAETEAGGGRLALTRWRAGKAEEVTLKLPVLGTFSATAPYDCPKSQRILDQGLKALAARMAQPDYAKEEDAIPRSLNALALLAGGDAAHLPLVKREAQWAADFTTHDFKTWYYGYVMIFLAEYITATGDASVLPGLRRLAMEAANGQSAVGSWGHTFALPDGRLQGYGMMNAPGLPLTIGMVLARDAGVKDAEVARAIELSARLLRFYTGKGAVPYGDHPAWTETHEDNGKCGMAAVLFNRLGEAKSADFFTRMAVASHGSERDCGHTGNYFNMLWSLPAIAQAGPHATGAWMQEFGAWYHDLARRWDGAFPHQGPPEPDHDSYHGWDATGAYLLAYALPLKKIALTGRKPGVVQPLTPAAAQSLIADGRGWDNKDRKSTYDRLADTELLARLGSWSPIVRERAAAALARRKEPPLPAIIALLDSANLDARIGACHALEELARRRRARSAAASPHAPARRPLAARASRHRARRHWQTGPARAARHAGTHRPRPVAGRPARHGAAVRFLRHLQQNAHQHEVARRRGPRPTPHSHRARPAKSGRPRPQRNQRNLPPSQLRRTPAAAARHPRSHREARAQRRDVRRRRAAQRLESAGLASHRGRHASLRRLPPHAEPVGQRAPHAGDSGSPPPIRRTSPARSSRICAKPPRCSTKARRTSPNPSASEKRRPCAKR